MAVERGKNYMELMEMSACSWNTDTTPYTVCAVFKMGKQKINSKTLKYLKLTVFTLFYTNMRHPLLRNVSKSDFIFYFNLQTWQDFECITKILKPTINYIFNVLLHQQYNQNWGAILIVCAYKNKTSSNLWVRQI